MKGESCVICGAPIPEGRQVCLSCDAVHRAPLDVHSYVDENTHANVWTGYARFDADVRRVNGALYGALYKLKDYEETGLSPDEVRAMLDEKNG